MRVTLFFDGTHIPGISPMVSLRLFNTKMKPAHTIQHNRELSSIFKKMADCYRYMGPEQRFRVIAYDTASRTLSNLKEPVDVYGDDIKKLETLKGVGESIATKIIEYIHTGKIEAFEKLRLHVPYDLLELMDVSGIGPSAIRILHDELGIQTRKDLETALRNNTLTGIKGLGGQRLKNMKAAFKFPDEKKRIPLSEATQIAEKVKEAIKSIRGVDSCTIAGSIRRKQDTVGDIDIVVVAKQKDWNRIVSRFIKLPFVQEVRAAGPTRASVMLQENNIQVDIRIVHYYEYGAALLYFTGSREHTIWLRTLAKQRGWKINEYGVFDVHTGKKLAGETEDQIYRLLGFKCIPPEERTGEDEFEKYRRKDHIPV